MKQSILRRTCCASALIVGLNIHGFCLAQSAESTAYMGAPVELVEAPNGAITNKKLLDRVGDFNFIEPTIDKLAEGVWQFGGYGLAPMSIIETDEGLIAFDTGDTVHDGELMLEAIRTVTQKPVKVIIYGHSHTVMGAGIIADGNEGVMIIGHPELNDVVASNLAAGGRSVVGQEKVRQTLEDYLDGASFVLDQTNSFVRFDFADGATSGLDIRRAIAEFVPSPDDYDSQADITLKMSGETWAKVYLSQATPEQLIGDGEIVVDGDAAEAARLLNLFDRYSPAKAVVVRPAFLEHGL